jgi:hypothetical protein
MALPGFPEHPKFRTLVKLLGLPVPYAWGLLECLWAVGYASGNPVIGDAADIELAAQFPGEPGTLFDALLTCRLIDETGDGRRGGPRRGKPAGALRNPRRPCARLPNGARTAGGDAAKPPPSSCPPVEAGRR